MRTVSYVPEPPDLVGDDLVVERVVGDELEVDRDVRVGRREGFVIALTSSSLYAACFMKSALRVTGPALGLAPPPQATTRNAAAAATTPKRRRPSWPAEMLDICVISSPDAGMLQGRGVVADGPGGPRALDPRIADRW